MFSLLNTSSIDICTESLVSVVVKRKNSGAGVRLRDLLAIMTLDKSSNPHIPQGLSCTVRMAGSI